MSRDRPDSDQERRLSKGSALLPPNHPPGMETRGPGKEDMQELQGTREKSPIAPIRHSAGKKPNLMPSLAKPWVPQSFPETVAGSVWEEWS